MAFHQGHGDRPKRTNTKGMSGLPGRCNSLRHLLRGAREERRNGAGSVKQRWPEIEALQVPMVLR